MWPGSAVLGRRSRANRRIAKRRHISGAAERGEGGLHQERRQILANLLSDKFVKQEGGVRVGKTEAVERISANKCEVKTGWTFTEPHLLKIDDDAYVLSYVSDIQGICTTVGKTHTIPSPVRAATIWVRDGKQWQVAFHGANQIVNPAAQPDADAPPAKSDAAKAKPLAAPASPQTRTDPITGTLMAAENGIWSAWKDKDARRLEHLTARQVAFVDIFGTHFDNKADTLKDWTGPICSVKGFKLTNGAGTTIAKGVAILTLTAQVSGVCGGKDIGDLKVYGNSVYVKDGNAWKWAFGFNSPT